MMPCFDDDKYLSAFLHNRYITDNVILKFIRLIEKEIEKDKLTLVSVLDIGAGLGRFSIPLAIRNKNIVVECIDSSPTMVKSLTNLCIKARADNIIIHQGDILAFSPKKAYNIIIASEVLHLFSDKSESIANINRMLCCDGSLFTRMPFNEQLLSGDLYSHFPEALEIDKVRHYWEKEFYEICAMHNLLLEKEEIIKEEILIKGLQYLNIFKNKAYSTLHILEDQIFIDRMNKLYDHVDINKTYNHAINMTLNQFIKVC